MTNRLIHETSPYLIQHADNPVDWYPWGDEALQKAASTNRPIFLSIGYSACHWCHVMAHESFESEDVAAFLNSHFVSVKVDREERPDIDSIYMAAVQALTGGGGWPMSVFLTPHGDPFYGGTYFPSVPRRGLPSFPQVLEAVAKAWQTRPNDLIAESHRLSAILRQGTCYPSGATAGEPSFEILAEAFRRTYFAYDREDGGWGTPKFPLPMILEFLLRYDHLAQDSAALGMVTHTLETMARGGLYDHLGGGFHRYCVDRNWTVPHFEKMLYDNAQLARVYLHAWQVTGESLYRSITEETLDYVAREMTDPRGGFYSSEDADSEGEEGRFFLWRQEEIHRLLGPDAAAFCGAHGITHQGNFEGQNVIRFSGALSTRASFATSRQKLLEARALRTRPARDDKVLTSWNGLMLAAFSEAARALERPDYLGVAERNANFLLTEMWSGERLFHAWRRGTAKQNAFLEDYACLLEGVIELYQTSFDSGLCMAAQDIASRLTALFAAPDGGFYDTSHDHEPLVLRPRELQDNAMPSGSAMASNVLLRLGALAANAHYVDLSLGAMRPLQSTIAANPLGYGQWLQAACAAVSQPCEVAICGELGDVRTRAMLSVVRAGYRPFQMVALGMPTVSPAAVPLLRERSLINGEPTAYVCSGAACQAPVGDPEALESLLEQFAPLRRARGFRTE